MEPVSNLHMSYVKRCDTLVEKVCYPCGTLTLSENEARKPALGERRHSPQK